MCKRLTNGLPKPRPLPSFSLSDEQRKRLVVQERG
jgi:hypothetical protein